MAVKPEEMCVSLETAKRLVDAGIVVESLYSWGAEVIVEEYMLDYTDCRRFDLQMPQIPAPTAEELLKVIPTYIVRYGTTYHLVILPREDNIFEVFYAYWTHQWNFLGDFGEIIRTKGLCEALSELVVKLKEAGYELNKFDK